MFYEDIELEDMDFSEYLGYNKKITEFYVEREEELDEQYEKYCVPEKYVETIYDKYDVDVEKIYENRNLVERLTKIHRLTIFRERFIKKECLCCGRFLYGDLMICDKSKCVYAIKLYL